MSVNTFERIEKKYWMSCDQEQQMMALLNTYMKEDQYSHSCIRNIYCDTDDYYLIRRSNEKPRFKEKLRIRSYSGFTSDDDVFVEIKRKVAGIGYKRRIQVPFSQAKRLLAGERISCAAPQIERELHEFIMRYHPKMKVFLTYDRLALTGKDDPSLRITIDHNIRYRVIKDERDLEREGLPSLGENAGFLMEIKAAGSMPQWLIDGLSRLHIYSSSFSKIGDCFTRHIAPELSFSALDSCDLRSHSELKENSFENITVNAIYNSMKGKLSFTGGSYS